MASDSRVLLSLILYFADCTHNYLCSFAPLENHRLMAIFKLMSMGILCYFRSCRHQSRYMRMDRKSGANGFEEVKLQRAWMAYR